MSKVWMHGPAFAESNDEPKKIVNREVPKDDVVAFEQAGYVKGKDKDAETVEAGEGGKAPKKKDK